MFRLALVARATSIRPAPGASRSSPATRGRRTTAVVDLRRLRKGRYTVKIVAFTSQGRQVVGTRRRRTCAPKKRR